MFKKRENIVMLVLVVLMVIAIVGVSYAAFSYSKLGTKVNTITTGSITMSYEETDNTISLNGALPTTDKTGKVRLTEGEYFDFKVSSSITGNVNINYEISAKDVTTSDRKIDGSNIKLYLTEIVDGKEKELMTPEVYNEEASSNTYTGRPANEMSLYTSSMNSSEEHQYRLRMYVDESYNPQGDGGNLSFSVKINVYGKDGDKMPVTTGPANEVLLSNIPEDNQYDDGVDTFITGEDPNNYIWYSGKLWRAVSVNNEAKTTKLVTQWNISAITYSSGSAAFEGSYMEEWLNDTTVDGFLGNLRDYEDFIVIDSVWDATMDDTELGSLTRPNGTTTVTDAVGLLNMYEYQSSNNGGTDGYLNNGLSWGTLTPYRATYVSLVNIDGTCAFDPSSSEQGVRPSINLKSNIEIVDGDGTINNPYRLSGDNDTNISGTLLNTRYSGEYIRFGTGENNLYRIVSHETSGLTKITSAEPLKSSGSFITSIFGENRDNGNYYSSTSTIGTFLNGDYLTNYVGDTYNNMIEDNTTWYLGTTEDSYKLAKYTDTNMSITVSTTTDAKVGLLRLGELMSGQFERYALKGGKLSTGLTTIYWLITPHPNMGKVWYNDSEGTGSAIAPRIYSYGIKPTLNLKSNVAITGGEGTKGQPFEIALQ